MNWQEEHRWYLYGVPDGPYLVEKVKETIYDAWLEGHKYIGRFETLNEAQKACEEDAMLIDLTPEKRRR